MDIASFNRRILSDSEFLEYLDYALEAVGEFEKQAEVFCDSLKKRAATHV